MEQNQVYCQYREGVCAERVIQPDKPCLFFAYPSKPKTGSEAMQNAVRLLHDDEKIEIDLIDWQDLPVEGNIIFCEICRGIKKSTCTILNTTQVNFNIMFEYGFAIGTGRAIWIEQ